MNDDRRSLRDIAELASERHGGARGRALDRVAKKAGLTLSYTTVDRILAGNYTSEPRQETLVALAALSGVDLVEVYRAAGMPYPLARLADQLPPDADLLSGAQREAVIAVVRQFAAANRALHLAERGEGHDRPAPTTPPPSDELSRRRREAQEMQRLAGMSEHGNDQSDHRDGSEDDPD